MSRIIKCTTFAPIMIVMVVCIMSATACGVDDPAVSSEEAGLSSDQPSSQAQAEESASIGSAAVQTDKQPIQVNDSLASMTPSRDQAIGSTDPSLVDTDIVPEAKADCLAGWFCLWQDAGFQGRKLMFQGTGCQDLTTFGFNDAMSSWFNNGTPGTYRVYKDIRCVTFLFQATRNTSASQTEFNDQASSICRGTGCP